MAPRSIKIASAARTMTPLGTQPLAVWSRRRKAPTSASPLRVSTKRFAIGPRGRPVGATGGIWGARRGGGDIGACRAALVTSRTSSARMGS